MTPLEELEAAELSRYQTARFIGALSAAFDSDEPVPTGAWTEAIILAKRWGAQS